MTIDLSVPLAWTQGMRPDNRGAPLRKQTWQEVLWRRLTGRFGGLKTGEHTAESERFLDIGRNVYYYIGTSHPDFGLFVVAFDKHAESAVAETIVSPFDTGGIARGYTALIGPVSPEIIVHRESYPVGEYQTKFSAWVDAAYPIKDDYSLRRRPTHVTTPEIDYSAVIHNDRAWIWEGRVGALDQPEPPLEPAAVFFSPGRRRRYKDWIIGMAKMSSADSTAHLELISRIGRDHADPARAARELILGVKL